MTGQYYLRSRYYNPVIARFTQEDTYYGDGLNLYIYCQNNPILNHDPTGHGTKENSPYSRKEQQYIDAGADPDTAKLETQCYPDAKSKQDLYNKYKSQGYNATDAKKLANYEIVHGEEKAKNYAANNVKKSGPDYTPTSPRDNVNTDWRTQNRLNAQKKAGAGKSGTPSTTDRIRNVAQQSFDYAVNNPRKQGLNRMQLGKDAEIQATRWTRKWAERNGIDLSESGLHFQVRGEHSIPDVVYEPTKNIMDFKLTPKAVRKKQSDNFKSDFPGYSIEYIFGPGPWREQDEH